MPYADIRPSGAGTAEPLNLARRIARLESACVLPGRRVLDAGCGPGAYVAALQSAGAVACGVEYRTASVKWPRSVVGGDIERLPFADGTFDVVLLNEVLEHVPDDAAGLREVRRVLAPVGTVAVFSPNRLYPFETHGVDTRQGRALSMFTPFVPYVPLRVGERLLSYRARNYWPWELRALVRRSGFRITSTGYIWQTFEHISGRGPGAGAVRRVLRKAAVGLERVPGARVFGVSQVIFAVPD